MADVRWGVSTDPGRIRPENEDNFLAERNAFVVADGMGGHRAGEVASALAVDRLRERLAEPSVDLEYVVGAIAEVNGDIYRAAIGNPDQHGMGTTVTALVVMRAPAETTDAGSNAAAATDGTADATTTAPPEQLALVNVGDSRTYLFRHGRLRRVTVDHSYVQELVATGHITDDEARTHPRRNIVTRALGIDPAVRIDAWTLPIVRGDRFVLCSDGLVDEVRDDEIVTVLNALSDPQAAADELVAFANRQGGRDNITVIVVDVLEGAEAPDPDTELDLDPAWEHSDDEDAEEPAATAYGDLAALVSGDDEVAAVAGQTTSETATTPAGAATPPRRRKRRLAGFFGGLGVLAVLVLALVIASAFARRNFFVAFDAHDDVVLYRGRNGGFLWFDPTVEAPTNLNRDALDDASQARVEREPNFDSRGAAERFLDEQLETTTTSSTTTTTTIPATTTTAAATTTTVAAASPPPATPAP